MEDGAAVTGAELAAAYARFAERRNWGTFLWHVDDVRLAELRAPGVGGARLASVREVGVASMRHAFDALFGPLSWADERAIVTETVGVALVHLSLFEPAASLGRKVIEAAAAWAHAQRVTWADLRRGSPRAAAERPPGPRLATGVPALDRCLGGGQRRGTAALLLGRGPVGSLLAQLAARATAQGLCVVHVRAPDDAGSVWRREAPDPLTITGDDFDVETVLDAAARAEADLIVVDDAAALRVRTAPDDATNPTTEAFERLRAFCADVERSGEPPAVVVGCDPDASAAALLHHDADAVLRLDEEEGGSLRLEVRSNRHGPASASAGFVNVRGTFVELGNVAPTLHGFSARAVALLHYAYALKAGAPADEFRSVPPPDRWESADNPVWVAEARRVHKARGGADALIGARGWNDLATEVDAALGRADLTPPPPLPAVADPFGPAAEALSVALDAVGAPNAARPDVQQARAMMNVYGCWGRASL